MKRYEAMFLFDTAVARDWASIEQEVRRLLSRIGGELLVCVKFDERKLAYEIKRRKRGTYVLTYLDAPPDRIGELERDAQLSETIMRLLVVRADHLSEEKLAQLKAHPPETPLMPLSSDGHRHDDRRGYGERRGPMPFGREAGPPVAEASVRPGIGPGEEIGVETPIGDDHGKF